jgi:hypothetical protein
MERFYERNARILAAASSVGPPLIFGFGLQRDAETLDTCRIARFVEAHPRNSDARIVAARDEPREQVELPIRATRRSRIQDTLDLMGISRLGLHQHSQTLQLKPAHRFPLNIRQRNFQQCHGVAWLELARPGLRRQEEYVTFSDGKTVSTVLDMPGAIDAYKHARHTRCADDKRTLSAQAP